MSSEGFVIFQILVSFKAIQLVDYKFIKFPHFKNIGGGFIYIIIPKYILGTIHALMQY